MMLPRTTTQRGATVLQWLVTLILLASLALIALRLQAPYRQDMQVNRIIQNVVNRLTVDARTATQVRLAVNQQFTDQRIALDAKDILQVRSDNAFIVEKQYEHRSKFIGPIDIVINFNKTFTPESNQP